MGRFRILKHAKIAKERNLGDGYTLVFSHIKLSSCAVNAGLTK